MNRNIEHFKADPLSIKRSQVLALTRIIEAQHAYIAALREDNMNSSLDWKSEDVAKAWRHLDATCLATVKQAKENS